MATHKRQHTYALFLLEDKLDTQMIHGIARMIWIDDVKSLSKLDTYERNKGTAEDRIKRDALHRFKRNLAQPRSTRVRLAERNFTPIGAREWERGPKNCKTSTFLVKSRPAWANPLTERN